MANKNDIQLSIIELQAKKSSLGLEKSKKQAEIAQVKGMLKVVKQGHETHDILCEKKRDLVADINEIELQIMRLGQDIKKRQLLKQEVAEMENPKEAVTLAELEALKTKYKNFAGDRTRINNMRTMANEFANELESIIKKIRK